MSVPDAPLSSEVITHVASEFVGLSNRVKAERLFSFKELTCERYGEFAACESLMLLSILSHSATFREAAETWDDEDWSTLVKWIRCNVVSIGVFAKLRGLNYETSLQRVAKHIPVYHELSFLDLGNPKYEINPGPTDLWVISEEHGIKPPSFQGKPQLHIDHNIYEQQYFRRAKRPQHWPKSMPYPSNPTLRRPGQGECACCNSTAICACDPTTHPAMADTLVELHNYGDYKGTGVRALQDIDARTLLGEYVGELRPAGFNDDPVYGFDFTALDCHPHEVIATISAKESGNWTRFVNHSCRPNCAFDTRAVGGRICVLVVAMRAIGWGEELTVHYGDGYWTRRQRCLCGEDCCPSRVWEEEDRRMAEEDRRRAEEFLERLGRDSLGFGGLWMGDLDDRGSFEWVVKGGESGDVEM